MFNFPYTDLNCVNYTVASGSLSHVSEALFENIPESVIICLVKSAAFHGAVNKDPFAFFHNNLTNASLLLDGDNHFFPSLKFSVPQKQYMHVYRHLLNLRAGSNEHVDISLDAFLKQGNFLIPLYYNTSQDNRYHLSRAATIRVQLGFSTPTDKNLNVIVFYTTRKLLAVNKNGVFIT